VTVRADLSGETSLDEDRCGNSEDGPVAVPHIRDTLRGSGRPRVGKQVYRCKG